MQNLLNIIVVSKSRFMNEINNIHDKLDSEYAKDDNVNYKKIEILEKEIESLKTVIAYMELIESESQKIKEYQSKANK